MARLFLLTTLLDLDEPLVPFAGKRARVRLGSDHA